MILDRENEYSDSQTVTVSAPSTDIIDHGAPGDAGEENYLVIQVDEAAAAAGAATVEFKLETDDNSGFSSAKQLWSSGAIGKATLVAGYQVAAFRIPKGMEQYSRLYYTVATGPLTAGKFSAFLTPNIDHDIT